MSEAALEVLYRDARCAVINKPAGLMAHASGLARGEDDFLLHRLRDQFASKVHLIHRLDRATSGCVLVAFDAEAASVLGKAFMGRDVEKDYLAVCRGWRTRISPSITIWTVARANRKRNLRSPRFAVWPPPSCLWPVPSTRPRATPCCSARR